MCCPILGPHLLLWLLSMARIAAAPLVQASEYLVAKFVFVTVTNLRRSWDCTRLKPEECMDVDVIVGDNTLVAANTSPDNMDVNDIGVAAVPPVLFDIHNPIAEIAGDAIVQEKEESELDPDPAPPARVTLEKEESKHNPDSAPVKLSKNQKRKAFEKEFAAQEKIIKKAKETRQSKRREARVDARQMRKKMQDKAETFFSSYEPIHNYFASSYSEDPKNVLQAFQNPGWTEAVNQEFNSLEDLKSWEEVPSTEAEGSAQIPVKWLFKRKVDSAGNTTKLKARLVVQGCYEEFEGDVYAPVLRRESFKFPWDLAVRKGWSADLCDISNAFLQSSLSDEHIVYLKEIPGFPVKNVGHVRRLKKSLYGLKIAPHLWNLEISTFFVSIGYTRSKTDPYLFYMKNQEGHLTSLIGLYVEDIILLGEADLKALVKDKLMKKYKCTDSGLLTKVLGLKVKQELSSDGTLISMKISAPRHIKNLEKDIPDRFHDGNAKIPKQPMRKNFDGTSGKISGVEDQSSYRKLLGAALYIGIVRPDISLALAKLSRFASCPTLNTMIAIMELVRYLQSTMNLGLEWRLREENIINVFADADWASDTTSRRSVGGFSLFGSACIIAFGAKRQCSVANSSTESELIALGWATRETMYVDKFFEGLEGYLPKIKFHEDNKGCYDIAKAGMYCVTSKLKHVAIQHFICAEYLKMRADSSIVHISTTEQIADIFTKPLENQEFLLKRDWLGMTEC
eukprot:TRINITY_DN2211_c0_g1_i21.p1 TRINITY_DN2211_c0_g1~~TRINITY_DN2211_c0_g1_i21.p1  ORF type:complete len:737 (+),score=179.49 TRINITY_DN2211_c0_g1_i21:2429-4639(+)